MVFSDLSFAQRVAEYDRIKSHRMHHVPAILVAGTPDTPAMDKDRFLLPKELTFGQLMIVVRRRLFGRQQMESATALFLLCNNKLVSMTERVGDVYQELRCDDGFLYIRYSIENVFGGPGSSYEYSLASIRLMRSGTRSAAKHLMGGLPVRMWSRCTRSRTLCMTRLNSSTCIPATESGPWLFRLMLSACCL